jgi:hypothetical protein
MYDYIPDLSVKYSNWVYWAPLVPKLGTKSKVRMKIVHSKKKERNKLDFSPKIDPHRSFTPIVVFAFTWPFTAGAHILHY